MMMQFGLQIKMKILQQNCILLADFDSSVVRDTTNVLNAYKSGKLGGVPNLGDYYIGFGK